MGRGTSRQKASLLHGNYLSEDIKTRTTNVAESYSGLKEWLTEEYGRAERIVSEILAGMSRKRKPTPGNKKERYKFFSDISLGLVRLDKLTRTSELEFEAVENILYSRTSLKMLLELLPESDLDHCKRAMAQKRLDWKNPSGPRTFSFFKSLCETERNIMDTYKDIEPLSQKVKGNSYHSVTFNKRVESGSEEEGGLHTTNYTPPKAWFSPGLKFPCPLSSHDHEMNTCREFKIFTALPF